MHACIHTYMHGFAERCMCQSFFPQEKMAMSMSEEAAKFELDFYKKLQKQNPEAFEKLYSSCGSNAEFPQFPKHLWELGDQSCGWWSIGDPSTNLFKSWLVAKFKGLKPDLEKEVQVLKVVDKILPIFLIVAIGFLAKLMIDDAPKLMEYISLAKLVAEISIFVILLKLLKVATIMQFVLWKSFGLLAKLEFAIVCSGGNANKLLSMSAEKLRMIELREQESRGDTSDSSRGITTYLLSCATETVAYLQEGVRRKAQSWVETRRMLKDLEPAELQAAWEKIREQGFSHAIAAKVEEAKKAKEYGYLKDATVADEQIAKFSQVQSNPTEVLEEY